MPKKRVSGHIRIEHDSEGPVKVPYDAYYGISTLRASGKFPVSGFNAHAEMQKALIHVKLAAALANKKLKTINSRNANAIIKACKKLLSDYERFNDQFITDIFHDEAGKSWDVNTSEVITNLSLVLAGHKKGNYKIISPKEDVNCGQSTSDVVLTSAKISYKVMEQDLKKEVSSLAVALRKKAVKKGFPGQDLIDSASSLENLSKHLTKAGKTLLALQISESNNRLSMEVVKNLKKQLKIPFINIRKGTGEKELIGSLLEVSSVLRSMSNELARIGEKIPNLQRRTIKLVSYQISGNDETIKEASTSESLDLIIPVLSHNLLQSLEMLTNSIRNLVNSVKKLSKKDLVRFK